MSKTFQPDSLHPYIMDARLKKATGSGGISSIPIASAETLGGIKVPADSGITIDGSGNAYAYKPINYSTNEVKTGRKWIDGKDIYEKVISLDTPLTVSRNGSDTGIAPFHETMISAKGNATNGSYISFMEFVQDSTIHLACSNDFAVDNIIFSYTKPTTP